jgi:inhibitor of cysteine peptidase
MQFKRSLLLIFLMLFMSSTFGLVNQRPFYSNSHQIIEVYSTKPSFALLLPANPTTGYQWTIKQYDSGVLTLDKQDYMPSTSQLAGAGGHSRWYFTVNPPVFVPGQERITRITLVYARSFAPKDNPKEVTFTVKIKADK